MVKLIMNDLKNYAKYHYLSIFIIISALFGFFMGMSNFFPPIIYVYISVFIMPVISYTIGLVIGQQQDVSPGVSDHTYAISKILSASIIQLIPMIIYLIVYKYALNVSFNVLFFSIIYIVSSVLHIMIGLSLSMIAKSSFALSSSYMVYLIVFSIIPIFYSLGHVNNTFISYVLIISPAYLAGVMFEALIDSFYAVEVWFTYVAFIIQLIYMILLYLLIIKPFISHYLAQEKKQFD